MSAYPKCVLVTRSEKIRNKTTRTVSAEERNGDECFGVWYQDSQEGIIFNDSVQPVATTADHQLAVSALVFTLTAFSKICQFIIMGFVAYLAAESFKNTNFAKNIFGKK